MSQRRKDWELGRRLYEEQGKDFTQIGEAIGASRNTVSARAKTEGWIQHSRVVRESSGARQENILRSFIERDSEAIRRSLEQKHEINQILLRATKAHAKRLEGGTTLMIKAGTDKNGEPFYVEEDPILAIRRCALTVQSIEAVDRSIAGLKDETWRGGAQPGAPGTEQPPRYSPEQIEKMLGNDGPSLDDGVN